MSQGIGQIGIVGDWIGANVTGYETNFFQHVNRNCSCNFPVKNPTWECDAKFMSPLVFFPFLLSSDLNFFSFGPFVLTDISPLPVDSTAMVWCEKRFYFG